MVCHFVTYTFLIVIVFLRECPDAVFNQFQRFLSIVFSHKTTRPPHALRLLIYFFQKKYHIYQNNVFHLVIYNFVTTSSLEFQKKLAD